MNSPVSSSIGYTMEEILQNPLYIPYYPLVWADAKDWGNKNE
jgi:hypothetical protein